MIHLLAMLLACEQEKPGETVDSGGEEGLCESFRYPDVDGDGHGDPAGQEVGCAGDGFAANGGDCDDADASVNPDAEEVCDGVDQDCDSEVDEEAADATSLYEDQDGDGFGTGAPVTACPGSEGLAGDGADCDDADASVHPGAVELCNTVDDDCDGVTDPESCVPEVPAADWGVDDVDGDGAPGLSVASGHLLVRGFRQATSTGFSRAWIDLDGDGLCELFLGNGGAGSAGSDTGRLYGFTGTDVLGGGLLAVTEATWSWQGADAADYAGYALASPGDLDADGHDDLVVAVPRSDVGASDGGAVLFLSGADLLAVPADTFGEPGLVSSDGASYLGFAISVIGDLDGDAKAELALSSEADLFGRVTIVSGAALPSASGTDADDVALVTLADAESGSWFGRDEADSAAADYDGDGLPDLVVAASHHDGAIADVGIVYVFAGDDAIGGGTLSTSDASATWESAEQLAAGRAVSAGGDADGDGAPDLVVGGYDGDDGRVWLLDGGQLADPGDHDLADARVVISAHVAEGTTFGGSLAWAGDVDGDGRADLLAGDNRFVEASSRDPSGRAWLFRGSSLAGRGLTPDDADAIFTAERTYSSLGGRLGPAGDIDFDGRDDIVLWGSTDDPVTDAGGTYVLLSPW